MGDSMMGDGIDHICDKLRAAKLENEVINIELNSVGEVVSKGGNGLLVKLLTSRYYNREAFKATLKKVWQPVITIQFSKMGEGFFMTEFEDQNDKLRVIRNGPWNFDKSLILIKEFEDEQQVKNISMKEASFWIQVHDLPLTAHNKYIGQLVGKSLARVKEVDLERGEVEWGEFMIVRVNMDITKPLIRRKKLDIGLL